MLRTNATDAATTYRPHPSEGMYAHTLAGVPPGVVGSGNCPCCPLVTDKMYHQYRVTITPYRRVDMVKISVKEFNDGGSPVLNIYKPSECRLQAERARATQTCGSDNHDVTRNRGYAIPAARR